MPGCGSERHSQWGVAATALDQSLGATRGSNTPTFSHDDPTAKDSRAQSPTPRHAPDVDVNAPRDSRTDEVEHWYIDTKRDMEAQGMKYVRPLFACVATGFFWVVLLVGRTSAEEATCQSLASWYAANPAQIDPGSLAALHSCIEQTMITKTQRQPQGGWPEDSETQSRDRGGWPTPPP